MKRKRLTPPAPEKAPRRLLSRNTPRKSGWDGAAAEDIIANHLKEQGWQILQRNFRCRGGEIDIIAREDDTLVFLEVKARTSETCGHASEAVTASKRKKIRKAALFYLAGDPQREQSLRFDVVTLSGDAQAHELEHRRDAFSATP